MKQVKISAFIAASFCGVLMTTSVASASPTGFPTSEPQGFAAPAVTTIANVKADARDDSIVTLRGMFVERLEKDKYLFRDEAGSTIVAELSDDRSWSHVVKDKVMTVTAEVDREWTGVEIDVIRAE